MEYYRMDILNDPFMLYLIFKADDIQHLFVILTIVGFVGLGLSTFFSMLFGTMAKDEFKKFGKEDKNYIDYMNKFGYFRKMFKALIIPTFFVLLLSVVMPTTKIFVAIYGIAGIVEVANELKQSEQAGELADLSATALKKLLKDYVDQTPQK